MLVGGLVDSALSEEEVDETLRAILEPNQFGSDPGCTFDTEMRFRQRTA